MVLIYQQMTNVKCSRPLLAKLSYPWILWINVPNGILILAGWFWNDSFAISNVYYWVILLYHAEAFYHLQPDSSWFSTHGRSVMLRNGFYGSGNNSDTSYFWGNLILLFKQKDILKAWGQEGKIVLQLSCFFFQSCQKQQKYMCDDLPQHFSKYFVWIVFRSLLPWIIVRRTTERQNGFRCDENPSFNGWTRFFVRKDAISALQRHGIYYSSELWADFSELTRM